MSHLTLVLRRQKQNKINVKYHLRHACSGWHTLVFIIYGAIRTDTYLEYRNFNCEERISMVKFYDPNELTHKIFANYRANLISIFLFTCLSTSLKSIDLGTQLLSGYWWQLFKMKKKIINNKLLCHNQMYISNGIY